MNKEELIIKMKATRNEPFLGDSHMELDNLLLEYINDKEITELFNSLEKWYA